MKVLLPKITAIRLLQKLNSAEEHEIGGVLAGEHVSDGVFRIVDMSFQQRKGTWIGFVRSLQHALSSLKSFFDKTSHDYKRFNYLGEWHSHPSFSTSPSKVDMETMAELIRDEQVGANFLVMLIVKSIGQNKLDASVTVFEKGGTILSGELVLE